MLVLIFGQSSHQNLNAVEDAAKGMRLGNLRFSPFVDGVCRGKVCCARAFHFPFKCSISSLIIVLICLISYPVILGGL